MQQQLKHKSLRYDCLHGALPEMYCHPVYYYYLLYTISHICPPVFPGFVYLEIAISPRGYRCRAAVAVCSYLYAGWITTLRESAVTKLSAVEMYLWSQTRAAAARGWALLKGVD